MNARRAIVHIGTEKTGTTALQDTLAMHRPELAERRFFYSQVAGARSHVRLAAYGADDQVRDDLRRKLAIDTPDDLAGFRSAFAKSLAAEARAHADCVIVFSSEHCHSRLVSHTSVARLAGLLKSLFDEIIVLVYLRRQDKLAVSRYSTMLKGGGTSTKIIDPAWVRNPYFDYWKLSRRWMEAFGEKSLLVRRFETDRLVGGSIVTDFCAALGMPGLAGPIEPANESLTPDYQAFLHGMNARVPRLVDGAANPGRGNLDRIVYDLGRGRGARPAKAAAKAFYSLFAEGNERVRARFFPDDATLFREDFSDYPETADDQNLSAEQVMDITSAIWREAMAERERLRSEISRLRARPVADA